MARNSRTVDRDARGAGPAADGVAARQPSAPRRNSGNGQVDEAARARILDALVALVGERGYAHTSVSRIVENANVSPATFHELFSDRHECFMVAFDAEIERIRAHLRDSAQVGDTWRARARRALIALLELFEEEPNVARLLLVDSLDAGERVLARRAGVLAELVTAVEAGQVEGDGKGVGLGAHEVVHAGVSVLEARLRETGESSLVDLVNPLMAMIVLPHHGLPTCVLELTAPLPASPRRKLPAAMPAAPNSGLRLSQRSLGLLQAVADMPSASNRALAERVGVTDEGQISRMLGRLERHRLVHNRAADRAGPNAWTLSSKGAQLLAAHASDGDGWQGPARGSRRQTTRSG